MGKGLLFWAFIWYEIKLKNIYHQFGTVDTRNWFKNRGVPLKIESDGRVFPTSNSSQSIIDCLVNECEKRVTKQKDCPPRLKRFFWYFF